MQGNRKILIVHPEGNFNNNPNLTGIIEILTEKGLFVDALCPRKEHYQFPINNSHRIIFYEPYHKVNLNVQDYGLIIGVDSGILEASVLAKIAKAPLGYISYEIFFEDEIGLDFKKLERLACSNIEFAVCQDKIRASLLSIENEIPIEKILLIPVAGREIYQSQRENTIKRRLNIPEDKKIALLMGSLSSFTMIDEILESVSLWPEDWVLLLHDRYSLSNKIVQEYSHLPNIYFSNEVYKEFDKLCEFVSSVDVGLAFYKSIKNDIYCGKNIENIGFASGKISTYLQCGIPILVNSIGIMADLIDKNKAGIILKAPSDIPLALKKYSNKNLLYKQKENAFKTFQMNLGINEKTNILIDRINASLANKKAQNETIDLELIYSDLLLNKNINYKSQIENLHNLTLKLRQETVSNTSFFKLLNLLLIKVLKKTAQKKRLFKF